MSTPPRIVVFEHGKLVVGHEYDCVGGGKFRFEAKHFEALARFVSRAQWKPYTLAHRSVCFGGWVGVLRIGRLLIEVLPKADRHTWETDDRTYWRGALTLMLRTARSTKLEHADLAPHDAERGSLVELYVARFVACVEDLLHHGLVRRYRRVEDNLSNFRGRLRVADHIRHNLANEARFFVEHTVYDHQHRLNEVLLAALHVVRELPVSADLHGRCRRCLLAFPPVELRRLSADELDHLSLDRATRRYREALELARLLLRHHMPSMEPGGLDVLALLVKMSRLFEDFVGQLCRKIPLPGLRVSLQRSVPFWGPDEGDIRDLRPDIVLDREGYHPVVIDAKWKPLTASGPSVADIRQIYAYNQYLGASHSILLYPKIQHAQASISGKFHNHAHRLSTAVLDLGSTGKPELRALVGQMQAHVEAVSAAKPEPSISDLVLAEDVR
jgi:5-methylcytosine-specific restriction enzyme subunit McrC